jgi:hypothetical protein
MVVAQVAGDGADGSALGRGHIQLVVARCWWCSVTSSQEAADRAVAVLVHARRHGIGGCRLLHCVKRATACGAQREMCAAAGSK